MKHTLAQIILLVAIAPHSIAFGLPAAEPDPHGIVIKPIPEKLVVLTFDDGCASSATIVAPILKPLGFGATFYISNFDSFSTRKDWYLTWRQMRALADDGFEVGNHSRGHGSFKAVNVETCTRYLLAMEDELVANNVPKPTTFCWPFYNVNKDFFPVLAANRYSFARGGHSRAYRPTVDNPFDVPSFGVQDDISFKTFVGYVRRATRGRIVVITFHGVPDGEHPSVGLEPATFRRMMRYLKDNNYTVIAMRDLGKYIDAARAAKLPPTTDKPGIKNRSAGDTNNPSDASGALAPQGANPYVFHDILTFVLPGLPAAKMSGTKIGVTVPYATDVTARAPIITVSAGATVVPASGTARDFTKPQTYTVTVRDGSTKAYTVTVTKTAASTAKDMLTFVFPGPISATISGTRIGVSVPPGTDVRALAPTFTLSPFATAVPASGAARNFTTPQTYTVTAQDGSTRRCTVTAIKASLPNTFTWSSAAAGNWSDGSKWRNNLATGSAPIPAGRPDYVLNFNAKGAYAATSDFRAGFLLNQLNFGGSSVTVDGKGSLVFTANDAIAALPRINQNSSRRATISTPISLASNVTVGGTRSGPMTLSGVISGAGGMTITTSGQLTISGANTYTGGTTINAGKAIVYAGNQTLGTGPVTVNRGGHLALDRNIMANALTLNGGSLGGSNGFGETWSGPITLRAISTVTSGYSMRWPGAVSGSGGFIKRGGGTMTLSGTNTYTGVTTVSAGTLKVARPASLYNGDTASWIPAKIVVGIAATLRVPVGGASDFTATQAGTLLTSLTTAVNNNGLTAGAIFGLDTANATGTVALPATITDSTGPGGGAFVLKKYGAGALQLSGANTYTGQTILDRGTLSVASLNRVVGGKASSSLGAPTTADNGEIVFGTSDRNGDCSLVYTGTGETTDRVINLAGRTLTATFDQSGTGLLKFASSFAISGYGHSKTIALKGSTAGAGEIAGSITNPYDRAGAATTALTKSGTGTWTLSGTNSYTGPTTVTGGVLACSNACSLGGGALYISAGAKLQLNYTGTRRVAALKLNGGAAKANGTYGSTASPATNKDDTCFSGTGTVTVAGPVAK